MGLITVYNVIFKSHLHPHPSHVTHYHVHAILQSSAYTCSTIFSAGNKK